MSLEEVMPVAIIKHCLRNDAVEQQLTATLVLKIPKTRKIQKSGTRQTSLGTIRLVVRSGEESSQLVNQKLCAFILGTS